MLVFWYTTNVKYVGNMGAQYGNFISDEVTLWKRRKFRPNIATAEKKKKFYAVKNVQTQFDGLNRIRKIAI